MKDLFIVEIRIEIKKNKLSRPLLYIFPDADLANRFEIVMKEGFEKTDQKFRITKFREHLLYSIEDTIKEVFYSTEIKY
jgi:hypothetical protein